MFGMPGLPNLDEMAKMVADFQVRHERMVSTIERLETKIDVLLNIAGVDTIIKEVIEHDDGN